MTYSGSADRLVKQWAFKNVCAGCRRCRGAHNSVSLIIRATVWSAQTTATGYAGGIDKVRLLELEKADMSPFCAEKGNNLIIL